MSEATNVCNGLDPTTGEPIDAIEATNLRRHHGNTLVVAPFKFNANRGVVETSHIDNGRVVWDGEVVTPPEPERRTPVDHGQPHIGVDLTWEQVQLLGVLPECFQPKDGVHFTLVIA